MDGENIKMNKIKYYRQKAGMTQEELSNFLEISINTIKSWDSGRRNPDKLKEKYIIEKIEEKMRRENVKNIRK